MPQQRRRDLDVGMVTRILEDNRACQDLRGYFGVGLGERELPASTGGRFELLDGGGDRDDACNLFTASDILSLEMLSVQLRPRVTLDLLEGALGDAAAAYLERIPTSVRLWDDGAAELIGERGPAAGLWYLLESQRGVGAGGASRTDHSIEDPRCGGLEASP